MANFFSIVIPTYNRAERLRIALESLVKQTYRDFEVIVCDDGSTDHTWEVVESLKNCLRLNYIWEENWGGPARPRNNGLKAAKGEWVCFLDSDDFWYPHKLEQLHQYIISNPDVDFVCHELILHNVLTGKKARLVCGPIVPGLYRDLLVAGNRFPNSAISVKKSSLCKFNISFSESKNFVSIEDYDFCLKLAFHNAKFSCINVPLGEYIVESNSLSMNVDHWDNLESLLKHHVFIVQTFSTDKSRLWRDMLCRVNTLKGANNWRKRKYLKAWFYMFKAMKGSPAYFFRNLKQKFKRELRPRSVPWQQSPHV
jgi:glycosyltransferase involved in cell wall biosynthesis